MPTLNWIGKEKVINHHMEVPFKVLDHIYGFDNGNQTIEETTSGNKIIHGDNLEALKALLPEYEGRIKCIYIDPPYNTGNEGWIYNDNVNDPRMRRWLNQIVGKEGDDLSRHDKWLCMMYPRLRLLHKLLSNDGAIFISIDDNEAHALKLLLDEIFGSNCFVADIIWKKRDGAPNDRKIGYIHEHILIFAKAKSPGNKKTVAEESFNLIERTEKANKEYRVFSEPDGPDPKGPFRKIDTTANGKGGRFVDSLFYPITNPYTKEEVWPRKGTCWRHNKEEMQRLQNENRLYWGVGGESKTPMRKLYLNEAREGMTVPSIWADIALNQHGAREIEMIFGEKATFDTPKPVDLIKRIVHIASNKESIILDSFAGSGTTAHAVLELNNRDGGNRKFILIQVEEIDKNGNSLNIAELITAERVKRVIKGYSNRKGTGGRFDYFELGPTIFNSEDYLNEEVGILKIRAYIYYTETKEPLPKDKNKDNEALLGKHNDTAYYFYYQAGKTTTLDHDFLSTIKTKAGQYVIYADNCLVSKDFLTKHNIIFKKIPRDILKL
jgi:adenine-specific DNA-methyltransferase